MWLSAPRPGHVGQALSQLWAGGGQTVLLSAQWTSPCRCGEGWTGLRRCRGPGDSRGGGGQLRESVLSQGLGGDGGAVWTGEI